MKGSCHLVPSDVLNQKIAADDLCDRDGTAEEGMLRPADHAMIAESEMDLEQLRIFA